MKSQSNLIQQFLKKTFKKNHRKKAIVAVSGGIDSAVSLTLTRFALGAENTHALLLPYGDQSTEDGLMIAKWNSLPLKNITIENIAPAVDQLCLQLKIRNQDHLRKGNLMARIRMIVLYDYAKKLDALVVGTENKSEEKLGYFTRFGDAASDLEPIQHLTKTEVRELSKLLDIPETFRTKAPSAGLWEGQTDETELGFSYEEADLYINASEAGKKSNLPKEVVKKIEG